jgi:hypothetical protein
MSTRREFLQRTPGVAAGIEAARRLGLPSSAAARQESPPALEIQADAVITVAFSNHTFQYATFEDTMHPRPNGFSFSTRPTNEDSLFRFEPGEEGYTFYGPMISAEFYTSRPELLTRQVERAFPAGGKISSGVQTTSPDAPTNFDGTVFLYTLNEDGTITPQQFLVEPNPLTIEATDTTLFLERPWMVQNNIATPAQDVHIAFAQQGPGQIAYLYEQYPIQTYRPRNS